jgi:NAD(P)-dependent dehydrogenase (short-subunit alcohol dehydrogenase family)
MRFANRTALVTGGGRGIGAAIVRRLAGEGARVVVADIDPGPANELAREVGGTAVQVDVTDLDAAQTAVAEFSPLDVLINNAGTEDVALFTDLTPARWRRLVAVNLESVLICTHAALPGMQAAGYGRIVNIASEAGRMGGKGGAAYSAAKGGVIAFTKAIARENARYGVTVNAVAPGAIDTPLLQASRNLGERGIRRIEALKAAPEMRRLGLPEEVAAAVTFLASEEASYITGETLGVSGGLWMD